MNFVEALKEVAQDDRLAVSREAHPADQQAWVFRSSSDTSTVLAQGSKVHPAQELFDVYDVEDILEDDWIVTERRSD